MANRTGNTGVGDTGIRAGTGSGGIVIMIAALIMMITAIIMGTRGTNAC